MAQGGMETHLHASCWTSDGIDKTCLGNITCSMSRMVLKLERFLFGSLKVIGLVLPR